MTQKTTKQTSIARLFLLVITMLIAAISLIQGAYLPGIIAAVGILLLYYVAMWLGRSEKGRSRMDLMDERLLDLEKRVRKFQERDNW